jgi:hypothetical protein
MLNLRGSTPPLWILLMALACWPARGEQAQPLSFNAGQEVIFTERANLTLGVGPASCVGLEGDLLVVGMARRSMGQPAVDPKIAVADDPYSIHDIGARWTTSVGAAVFQLTDQGTRQLAFLPTRHAPTAIAFSARLAHLYIADAQYLYCFEQQDQRFKQRWVYQMDGIRRVLVEPPNRVFLITSDGFERLADLLDTPELLHSHIAAVSDVFPQGNTALVFSPRGEVDLLELEHGGVIRSLGTVSLLGQARLARGITGARCLLLNKQGLEQAMLRDIMGAWVGRRAFFDMDQTALGKRDRGRLGSLKLDKPDEVEDLLVLGQKRAWLRRQGGTVEEVELDAAGKRIDKPRRLEALRDIVAMAGDEQRQVVVDRAGRVHLLNAKGDVDQTLPQVEAGPWVAISGQVFMASGPRVHRLDPQKGLVDIVLDLGAGYIREIKPAGNLLLVLGDNQLHAVMPQGPRWNTAATVELGLGDLPRFLAVGPGLAIVGSGERTLTSIDVTNPSQPRLLATLTPDLPLTWGGGQGYLRDVLIESDRVLIAAGEVHDFAHADLSVLRDTPPSPRLVIPRHFRSFDDMVQTKRIFRLGDGLYHCSSDRNTVIRRAWLMQRGREGTYQTQYTRLGTTLAQDMLMLDDGVVLVAAGRAGLRAIRWTALGEGELLGVSTEPDCHYEALLRVGDDLYIKNGNRVRIVTPVQRPRAMSTAFTFKPTNGPLSVQVNGLPVDSPQYQRLMGCQEPLKVLTRALGDDTGWPGLAVPQGEVWVDPQRGRMKFSDGRRGEPKLVGKLPTTLWGPIQANQWLEVGKYHLAPAGELGHGVIVIDVSDPDCPRQVAVSSTNPASGYANKSLGVRGHFAFISWNHPGPAIAVLDVSDPLRPRFVRSLGLRPGSDIAGHMDRNWLARFEDDRMLVTTSGGLYVFDVRDPANFTLVSRHEAMPALTAWDINRNLGAWIDRKNREFQIIDTTNRDQPIVRSRIALGAELNIVKPVNFDWHGDRLWLWGLTREGSDLQSVLACYDVSDPATPRKLGAKSLAGELNDLLRLDGTLAALAYRSGDIESYDLANVADPVRLGRIDAAQTQGRFQFALGADAAPVPYDNTRGSPPDRRYGQNTRFMLARGRIVWTTGPIVDFTDPAQPRLRRGHMQAFDDEVRGLELSPDRRRGAWYGGVDGFGWMIDLSDPRHPTLRWRIERVEPKQWSSLWVTPDWSSATPAVVETGRAFASVGPDPNLYHAGRPMTRFFSGNQVTMVSDPIAVPPGQTLTLSAIARTRPCAPRAASKVQITVAHWHAERRGRNLARVSDNSSSDRNVSLEATVTPDANMQHVVVEIQADLLAWLSELRLQGPDGRNLLPNAAMDQPLDDKGMHPGWRLTNIPKTLERIANVPRPDYASQRLYQAAHDSILIHDLSRPGMFAAGLLREAVLSDYDAILGLGSLRQGDRQLVIAATEQGMTVNDVTDLREPVTLGRMPLPWNFAIRPWIGAINPNTVVITTGYTSKRQTEGIYIVDISDPRQPRLHRYVYENCTQFSTHNGWLYKMSYRNGGQIYDLRTPSNPVEICDFLFDSSNSGDAPTAMIGDVLIRAHAGGVESWLAPCADQAPSGLVTVATDRH